VSTSRACCWLLARSTRGLSLSTPAARADCGFGCSAYYGLDLRGKLFPSIAPNDWWFSKMNMWHESMWFWNPQQTTGGGATPAHLGARFASETCFVDTHHSYDEHIWRPMIVDDPATGGEHMASKPVSTQLGITAPGGPQQRRREVSVSGRISASAGTAARCWP